MFIILEIQHIFCIVVIYTNKVKKNCVDIGILAKLFGISTLVKKLHFLRIISLFNVKKKSSMITRLGFTILFSLFLFGRGGQSECL